MRRIMLAIAVAALLTAGCSKVTQNRGTSTSGPSGRPAPNTADVTFAQMMIPHHLQAIEMAKLVPSRTTRPELRTLAASIVRSQTAEIQTLAGWLESWGKPVPSGNEMAASRGGMAMPGRMATSDMSSLKARNGKDFDLAFVRLMQIHHQGAMQMAAMELRNGLFPEAKQLARQITTAQQGEVDSMRQWQRQWSA